MSSKLFQPIQVGDLKLNHRAVMAPLTRFRADKAHVPIQPLVSEYYAQRASTPGTLLVSEATFIDARAGGYNHVPGIWSNEQIESWKKVTDAVHARGSYIYLQLWALGRAARPNDLAADDPSFSFVSASDIPIASRKGEGIPRPLTVAEVKEYVQLYAQASENAVFKAGFDGVEIHGANGYLVDQFLQDVSNHRTDEYGGPVENRARFALDIVDAVTKRVGQTKTAIRFSPWGTIQDMGMKDPKPTFGYVAEQLRTRYPNLAYVHLVEPRVDGQVNREEGTVPTHWSNDFIREIYGHNDGYHRTKLITAGGYDRNLAIKVAEEKGDLIAFGRFFISNPDLPYRLQNNVPLIKGDRQTYYRPGQSDALGYTDYPFSSQIPPTSGLSKTDGRPVAIANL